MSLVALNEGAEPSLSELRLSSWGDCTGPWSPQQHPVQGMVVPAVRAPCREVASIDRPPRLPPLVAFHEPLGGSLAALLASLGWDFYLLGGVGRGKTRLCLALCPALLESALGQ